MSVQETIGKVNEQAVEGEHCRVCNDILYTADGSDSVYCKNYHTRQQPKPSWTAITCEADLKQPPGLYWTTFVSEASEYVGSHRVYPGDDEPFASNTLAYMRIEEPEPWEDN